MKKIDASDVTLSNPVLITLQITKSALMQDLQLVGVGNRDFAVICRLLHRIGWMICNNIFSASLHEV